MQDSSSITVVVPALNEGDCLEAAVEALVGCLNTHFEDYEVLIFNDGSTDQTGPIADSLAARHPRVQAFHHETPHCMGGVIRRGWQKATKNYVMWVDGQGATTDEALATIFDHLGEADLIIPYAQNQHERPLGRRIIARGFIAVVNGLFGLNIRQYTHLAVLPTDLARRLNVRTDSYAFQAEALIKLAKSGCSYVQVGVEDNFQIEGRRSKAFRPQNVIGVAMFALHTWWDVYMAPDGLPGKKEPSAEGSAGDRSA